MASRDPRAEQAQGWVEKEVDRLLVTIERIGERDRNGQYRCLFGDLFYEYAEQSEALPGIMLRAKKRELIYYEGKSLNRGQDDDVWVTVLRQQEGNGDSFRSFEAYTQYEPSQYGEYESGSAYGGRTQYSAAAPSSRGGNMSSAASSAGASSRAGNAPKSSTRLTEVTPRSLAPSKSAAPAVPQRSREAEAPARRDSPAAPGSPSGASNYPKPKTGGGLLSRVSVALVAMRGGRPTMHMPAVRGVEPKAPTPHNYMPLPSNFVFVPKKNQGTLRPIKPTKQVVVGSGAIKVVAQQGSAAAPTPPPERRRAEPREERSRRTERTERTERPGNDNKLARAAAVLDQREGGPAKAPTPPAAPPRGGFMNRVSAALIGKRPRGVVSTANVFNNATPNPVRARGASTRPQSGNLRNLAGAFERGNQGPMTAKKRVSAGELGSGKIAGLLGMLNQLPGFGSSPAAPTPRQEPRQYKWQINEDGTTTQMGMGMGGGGGDMNGMGDGAGDMNGMGGGGGDMMNGMSGGAGDMNGMGGGFEQQQEQYGGGGGEQGFGGMQEQAPQDFGAQQFNNMDQGGGFMSQDQQASSPPPQQQQQQYTGPDPFANEPQGFFSRISTAFGFGGAQQASPPPQQDSFGGGADMQFGQQQGGFGGPQDPQGNGMGGGPKMGGYTGPDPFANEQPGFFSRITAAFGFGGGGGARQQTFNFGPPNGMAGGPGPMGNGGDPFMGGQGGYGGPQGGYGQDPFVGGGGR